MKTKLKEAVKDAMRAKDSVRLSTLRGLLSEIQYEEMNKNVSELPNEAVTAVLQREAKKRHESIEFAEKANRPETKEQLLQELSIIESYLPKQLSTAEIEAALTAQKQADPSLSVGAAMKFLKENFAGQYDGKVANEVAKKILA